MEHPKSIRDALAEILEILRRIEKKMNDKSPSTVFGGVHTH